MASLMEMQAEADRRTDASLAATRRIRRLGEETVASGAATLAEMEAQGRQLGRIEGTLDHINGSCKDAEKTLHEMEKFLGLFVLPWKRTTAFEKTGDCDAAYKGKTKTSPTPTRKDMEKEAASARGKGAAAPIAGAAAAAAAASAPKPMMKRVLNDAREDEMEANLDATQKLVRVMHEHALAMGTELDRQNEDLDRIKGKIDSDDARVKRATDRVDRLRR